MYNFNKKVRVRRPLKILPQVMLQQENISPKQQTPIATKIVAPPKLTAQKTNITISTPP